METIPKTIARYEILKELGKGSMSRVYLAYDPNLDREVALKILLSNWPPEVSEELRKRFVLEARAAGKLSHPGIVRVYDADTDPSTGVSFLAMEWVDGRSLQDLLEAEGKLPLRVAVEIIIQVAEALDYAHECGRVHRDVKPSNILLSPDGRARISDFGVAKILSESHTLTGHLLGTPLYMSPEQVKGDPIDGRSDLFSLGVVLYRSLSGSVPFGGDSLISVAYKIVNVDHRPLSLKGSEEGERLGKVLERILEKDPGDRFSSGQEMAAALRQIGEDWEPGEDKEVVRLALSKSPPTPAPEPEAAASRPAEDTLPVEPSAAPAEPAEKGLGESTVEILSPPVLDVARPSWLARRPRPRRRAGPRLARLAASVLWAVFLTLLVVAVIGRRLTPSPDVVVVQAEEAVAESPMGATTDGEEERLSSGPAPSVPAVDPNAGAAATEIPVAGGQPAVGRVLSNLEILYRHRYREGYMSVWVDQEKVWSQELRRSRNPLFWLIGSRTSAFLRMPEGLHSVEVRVTAPRKGIDASKVVESSFRGGETRRLKVSVDRDSNRLELDWEA